MLSEGQVVVYPTETLYGLLATVKNHEAVARIPVLKGRGDNPLPCVISDEDQLAQLTDHVTPRHLLLMELFWPGPLTLVFEARPGLPAAITAKGNTVGVRRTSHALLAAVIEQCGPVVATSANPTGMPTPYEPKEIAALFPELAVFDGGLLMTRQPSTVVGFREDGEVVCMREGAISMEIVQRELQRAEGGGR